METELIETVYEHLKGNDTFTVTAAERWSINMIHRLKKKFPDQVDIRYTNPDRSMLVHLPFEWMRIVPKKKDTLTDEQRAARSERMKAFRKSQLLEIAPISHDSPQGNTEIPPEGPEEREAR